MRHKPASFARRTATAFRHQARRAQKAGRELPYSLDQLRTAAALALEGRECPYCLQPLNVANMSFDHQQPVSRFGSWALANLVVCCRRCNETKGPLNASEFRQLRALIAEWSPAGSHDLLRRLRAGGRIHRG